jgi:UbiD family decarboxylase
MPFRDLQSFLTKLESQGDLVRIKTQVNPELEITEIVTRVIRHDGPALLFENVKGSRYPLAINLFGSVRRIETALGRRPELIGKDLINFINQINPPSLKGLWQTKKQIKQMLAARTSKKWLKAPVQEFTETGNLNEFPALKCWPDDAGRFITFPLVLTKDPLNGKRNLGIYRMQIQGSAQAGLHWQLGKGGGYHFNNAEKMNKELDVIIVLGSDPALMLSAALPLPEGIDEIAFSGFLRGTPLSMVKAKTQATMVPAYAEFIIEGTAPPHIRNQEGPFGDHIGHYSEKEPFPIFNVKAITHRKNPIFPAAVVGYPPQEDSAIGEAAQGIIGPLIKIIHPEIVDMWSYPQASFTNLVVVSVNSRYVKEPMKTALGLLGNGQLSLSKCVILVEGDVSVRNWKDVATEITHYFNPQNDFLLLPKLPSDTLDFTSFKIHMGSKMIIDATRNGKVHNASKDSHESGNRPNLYEFSSMIYSWHFITDKFLVISTEQDGNKLLEILLKIPFFQNLKILAIVSAETNLENETSTLWGIFSHFDPARDIRFPQIHLINAVPVFQGVLAIDATIKLGYPKVLKMDSEIIELVNNKWKEYFKK